MVTGLFSYATHPVTSPGILGIRRETFNHPPVHEVECVLFHSRTSGLGIHETKFVLPPNLGHPMFGSEIRGRLSEVLDRSHGLY